MMDDEQAALEVCGEGNPLKISGFFSIAFSVPYSTLQEFSLSFKSWLSYSKTVSNFSKSMCIIQNNSNTPYIASDFDPSF